METWNYTKESKNRMETWYFTKRLLGTPSLCVLARTRRQRSNISPTVVWETKSYKEAKFMVFSKDEVLFDLHYGGMIEDVLSLPL